MPFKPKNLQFGPTVSPWRDKTARKFESMFTLALWTTKTPHLQRPEQPLVLGSATSREPTVFGSVLRLGPHTLDRHTKFTLF